MSDPASDGCATGKQRSLVNIDRAAAEHGQVTLAYAVRIYPTAIKAWALGALCDLYQRQFNQQLNWCGQQEKLSMKGLAQAGTGEFAQRTKRQAIIAFKRSRKADQVVKQEAPYTVRRLVRAASRAKIKGNQKKAARLIERAERMARRAKAEFKPPYLRATTTLLPHAETQDTRKAKSFDGFIHLEGTTREWQIYLPYRRHRAINRALAYEGAKLSTSAEVFKKNDKWYGRLFVNIPIQTPAEPKDWIGGDVGARNAVVTSDGHHARGLHPIINHEKNRRAARQKAEVRHRQGMSYQRQALCKAARRLVSVAQRSGQGIALEDPSRLIRWKQHAARWLANRVAILASIDAVPLRLVNPAYTSVTCSRCGSRETVRKKQYFRCEACGLTLHADLNAARGIRLAALADSGRHAQTSGRGSHEQASV